MAQTLLANLINPQVIGAAIEAELTSAIRFNTVAELDYTLNAQPGNTITVPTWAYIGDAADLAEGVADIPVVLTASTVTKTVKKVAKSVELTDESVLSGYGDPVGQAAKQVAMSIGAKVDADIFTALSAGTQVYSTPAVTIAYAGVASAVMKFADEEMGVAKYLYVHPNQYGELLKDSSFIPAGAEEQRSGIMGQIAGCNVLISKKLTNGDALIVKPGAAKVYMKRDVNVEADRNILAKTNIIAADQHYVAVLADDSKVVVCEFKPTV